MKKPEISYLKSYECTECGHKWEDTWSCLCDDRCGECNTAMEVKDYEVLTGSLTPGFMVDEARNVFKTDSIEQSFVIAVDVDKKLAAAYEIDATEPDDAVPVFTGKYFATKQELEAEGYFYLTPAAEKAGSFLVVMNCLHNISNDADDVAEAVRQVARQQNIEMTDEDVSMACDYVLSRQSAAIKVADALIHENLQYQVKCERSSVEVAVRNMAHEMDIKLTDEEVAFSGRYVINHQC
ncbi:hypothetical protein ACYPKM_01955 [Pseudomonas aeruginosa]